MTSLELKRIAPEHLKALLELDFLCFGGLWTQEGYQRELDSPNSDLLGVFLGEQGSRGAGGAGGQGEQGEKVLFISSPSSLLIAMGCLWAILEEAHIIILAVHPDYRGQGLGQAILYALLKAACERGLERATLEVRVSNQAAICLYQKFGFKIAGQRRRYYQDTGEDALLLWRSGLNAPEFDQTLAKWRQLACDRLSSNGYDFAS